VNGSLLALDLLFVASTSTKLLDGGWFPLAISFIVAFLMLTWRKGQEIMDQARLQLREESSEFVERITADPPFQIPGTAVVLGRKLRGVPLSLTRNVKFNHVLHERVLLVAVVLTEAPRESDEERVRVTVISDRIARVELRVGFMESVDVPQGLAVAVAHGQIAECELKDITYYTGHETIIPMGRYPGMARWRERIFVLMHHNAQRPAAYLKIPIDQVMEIGIEFEI
jgi:KUP system potassium uptake protein